MKKLQHKKWYISHFFLIQTICKQYIKNYKKLWVLDICRDTNFVFLAPHKIDALFQAKSMMEKSRYRSQARTGGSAFSRLSQPRKSLSTSNLMLNRWVAKTNQEINHIHWCMNVTVNFSGISIWWNIMYHWEEYLNMKRFFAEWWNLIMWISILEVAILRWKYLALNKMRQFKIS